MSLFKIKPYKSLLVKDIIPDLVKASPEYKDKTIIDFTKQIEERREMRTFEEFHRDFYDKGYITTFGTTHGGLDFYASTGAVYF